jgi:hypothetical protein
MLGSSITSSTTSSSMMGSTVNFLKKVNVESFGLGGVLTEQLGTLLSAGVKALFPSGKDLHVTRIVDAVTEMKSDPEVDNYLYFDPKVQK